MADDRQALGDLEVRPIREDEFEAVLEVCSIAFGEELTAEDTAAWLPAFPFERSLGAYENGRMVATSAVLSLELTVPGGETIPMGGVTWISTLPTHRRRGILRHLLTAHFQDMAERGETVSGLGASEGIIYGRFGYGPATSSMSFSVEQAHAAFAACADAPQEHKLSLLGREEAATAIPAIHESLRRLVPGTVTRSPGLWQTFFADPPSEREGASRMLHVIHSNDRGEPDGYVSYRVKEDWKGATSHNEVKVVELLAADPSCYVSLWRYILDTDLAKTISCARGRPDEPLRWLLADPRRFAVYELFDFLWLRLVDVSAALAARRYAAAGELVLEISDDLSMRGASRYLLSVEPTSAAEPASEPQTQAAFPFVAKCSPTEATPDLVLDAGTLATIYLGGVSFVSLAVAGRVQELTPAATTLADAMFRAPTQPFCSTDF